MQPTKTLKTYTKQTTETKPRLLIEHDEYAINPRKQCDNLGYFITIDRNYNSPDDNDTLKSIIKTTSDEVNNQDEHIKLIKKEVYNETGEKVIAIYPVVKYEHSAVVYRLGTQKGFDYLNNGFYIITDKTQKEFGTKRKDFEKVIAQELKDYTQWCNGEVYQYILFDEKGEYLDGCSSFYSIDDIKENLPDEWKKENLLDYMKW